MDTDTKPIDTNSREYLMICSARHLLKKRLPERRKILAMWGDRRSRFYKGAEFVEEIKHLMTKEHYKIQQESMKKLAEERA